MILNLLLANERPVTFDSPLHLGDLPGVKEVLSLHGPVETSGRLDRTDHGYRLQVRFAFSAEISCSRCLGPISMKHEGDFELFLIPHGQEPTEDEHLLTPGELDLYYYDGTTVEADPLVAEQVVLAVPMKPLCREECLGICPNCGANRNDNPCGCEEVPSDSRWGVLADFKKSIKS